LQALRAAVIASAILPEKVDWLHFGFATPAIEREYIGKAIGAKVAVSFRGFDLNQMPLTEGNLYSKLWPNVDKVHSISNYLVTKARELGLPQQTPFTIITPAIDAQKFCPVPKLQQPNTILLVSRLHWIKGIEQVLEALAIVKSKGLTFNLTIAGEGDELERLLFARYQLGLTDEVSFVGRKSPTEVIEFMQMHEIFIQYSHQEGFCNAALEAQSCGMLCIVSDADGLKENVLNGQTGWVVPKRNPTALAEKIQEVLLMQHADKEQIRKQARTRVLKEFDLRKQELAFVDFYKG
jgi:colanic acid/amylovoran biosynthesis glycosyltransferase